MRIVAAYPAPEGPQASALREGAGALVEPLVFELDELEVTEGYLEIRQSNDGKVITVLEFLSPSNKRRDARAACEMATFEKAAGKLKPVRVL